MNDKELKQFLNNLPADEYAKFEKASKENDADALRSLYIRNGVISDSWGDYLGKMGAGAVQSVGFNLGDNVLRGSGDVLSSLFGDNMVSRGLKTAGNTLEEKATRFQEENPYTSVGVDLVTGLVNPASLGPKLAGKTAIKYGGNLGAKYGQKALNALESIPSLLSYAGEGAVNQFGLDNSTENVGQGAILSALLGKTIETVPALGKYLTSSGMSRETLGNIFNKTDLNEEMVAKAVAKMGENETSLFETGLGTDLLEGLSGMFDKQQVGRLANALGIEYDALTKRLGDESLNKRVNAPLIDALSIDKSKVNFLEPTTAVDRFAENIINETNINKKFAIAKELKDNPFFDPKRGNITNAENVIDDYNQLVKGSFNAENQNIINIGEGLDDIAPKLKRDSYTQMKSVFSKPYYFKEEPTDILNEIIPSFKEKMKESFAGEKDETTKIINDFYQRAKGVKNTETFNSLLKMKSELGKEIRDLQKVAGNDQKIRQLSNLKDEFSNVLKEKTKVKVGKEEVSLFEQIDNQYAFLKDRSEAGKKFLDYFKNKSFDSGVAINNIFNKSDVEKKYLDAFGKETWGKLKNNLEDLSTSLKTIGKLNAKTSEQFTDIISQQTFFPFSRGGIAYFLVKNVSPVKETQEKLANKLIRLFESNNIDFVMDKIKSYKDFNKKFKGYSEMGASTLAKALMNTQNTGE
jgi:hypothetical protein